MFICPTQISLEVREEVPYLLMQLFMNFFTIGKRADTPGTTRIKSKLIKFYTCDAES